MDKTASREVDFEALRELAQNDPRGFEDRRRELVEDLIARAPAGQRRRLRGLQWQVDVQRERAANPLAACITLSRMMWDSVAGSGGLLEAINGDGREPVPEEKPQPAAKVVPLPRRH